MDVMVVGEPLAEFSAPAPLTEADAFRLSFSGDALNAAVAAAATGAHVALVTLVGNDEFGERLIAFAAARGVDTRWMLKGDGSTGAYAVGADPSGERAFAYMRSGSAASRMGPADVARAPLAETAVLLVSGITAALSESCAAAVLHAARAVDAAGGRVVYDPNYRARLTGAEEAAAALEAIAPATALMTPSCPGDSLPLLGTGDPAETARACLERGARAVAVTRGAHGVLLAGGGAAPERIPAVPPAAIVDQTGAGDAFAGTVAARLALGDPLRDAVRAGTAAAAVNLEGQGGTGRVATPREIERLLDARTPGPVAP
ncbi:2-keto-3-deoxygluconate kinase [Sphaerisporangium krabiense]|uniref:2-dehydro-3-deoxygluconokinase n=2 Tax=Sphaerisporangium krabiense TaxID=763782 RepID=A0A7W8Z7A1_9ACTN|nr:2-dehydro-3-deoxygluconokinase [Sphaerisporangium krabiense]GII60506.1 2-keto-3-deoxygluconate kinase [Sphaerisporangium krabiense]